MIFKRFKSNEVQNVLRIVSETDLGMALIHLDRILIRITLVWIIKKIIIAITDVYKFT